MAIKIIKRGDERKQGNAVCPQCGEVVQIDNYWGDPLKCHTCKVIYHPIPQPPNYH